MVIKDIIWMFSFLLLLSLCFNLVTKNETHKNPQNESIFLFVFVSTLSKKHIKLLVQSFLLIWKEQQFNLRHALKSYAR